MAIKEKVDFCCGSLARTFQVARRCAGCRATAHAGLADVDALAHLLRVVILVQPRDADPLLIGVFRFIGAAGQKHSGQHKQTQTSHVLAPCRLRWNNLTVEGSRRQQASTANAVRGGSVRPAPDV